ncbi:MAG: Uma2 family endonuclease [candidate division KSB1 bacterium]|nr:Uma2 family endonuclease [candidate division KSB1 bacterium]MDZ7366563.1 Uma2 family endonuclease [candidate division KSB1 bacterium]MDZ7405954.1 Uma2 family endonuclease [candidate division KSB1 bacterium]
MVIFQVPAGMPEHNLLGIRIGNYLEQHLGRDLAVLYDTFSYVSPEALEKLGHFKNGDPHEYMQQRLLDLGASPSFIAEMMAHLLKQGLMPSPYAPDVCVVQQADFDNRFRVPLWIGEIISKDTREYDLYFKAYLYERLGVQEYFVFETGRRSGKLLRAYELKPEAGTFSRYQDIPVDAPTAPSRLFGLEIPVEWKI